MKLTNKRPKQIDGKRLLIVHSFQYIIRSIHNTKFSEYRGLSKIRPKFIKYTTRQQIILASPHKISYKDVLSQFAKKMLEIMIVEV